MGALLDGSGKMLYSFGSDGIASKVKRFDAGRFPYHLRHGSCAFVSDGIGAEHHAADPGMPAQRLADPAAAFDPKILFAKIQPAIGLHRAPGKCDRFGRGGVLAQKQDERLEFSRIVRRTGKRKRFGAMQRIHHGCGW